MPRTLAGATVALLLLSSLDTVAQGVGASAGGVGAAGGPGYSATEILPAGTLISAVSIDIEGVEDPAARARLMNAVRGALAYEAGASWDPVLGNAALDRVRGLPGVADAELRSAPGPGEQGYRLTVQLRVGDAPASTGPLPARDRRAFPTLYRAGDGYLKLELSGGHGVFSDGNPWFGRPDIFTLNNPMAENPALGADTDGRSTWTESLLQAGIAGATRLTDGGWYGFGAVTAIGVASYGEDIFRNDTRSSLDLEKAYAGIFYAPTGGDLRLKLSVGRQNYSLNTGFLVSQFGSQWNAGPRPGVYLAPRTTQDRSVIATARYADWKGTFFLLDPNELGSIESDTRLLGLNLAKATAGRWSWDVTALHVPESKTAYRAPDAITRSREGLWTAAGHLRMRTRPDRPGLWFEAEFAHQFHDDFAMSAWAGYAQLGYVARDLPWTPSLSYRYALFTGDDPETDDYERFDTLYSGGLDHWLQGISINKLLTQANRGSHRLRVNVAPFPELNLTLDLYEHSADERNNLGANPGLATLSSRNLGEEVQLTARWQVTPRVFALAIASAAFPGAAIADAAGGRDDPWTTLQFQLFWGF
mgnify:CR=1 FL=1